MEDINHYAKQRYENAVHEAERMKQSATEYTQEAIEAAERKAAALKVEAETAASRMWSSVKNQEAAVEKSAKSSWFSWGSKVQPVDEKSPSTEITWANITQSTQDAGGVVADKARHLTSTGGSKLEGAKHAIHNGSQEVKNEYQKGKQIVEDAQKGLISSMWETEKKAEHLTREAAERAAQLARQAEDMSLKAYDGAKTSVSATVRDAEQSAASISRRADDIGERAVQASKEAADTVKKGFFSGWWQTTREAEKAVNEASHIAEEGYGRARESVDNLKEAAVDTLHASEQKAATISRLADQSIDKAKQTILHGINGATDKVKSATEMANEKISRATQDQKAGEVDIITIEAVGDGKVPHMGVILNPNDTRAESAAAVVTTVASSLDPTPHILLATMCAGGALYAQNVVKNPSAALVYAGIGAAFGYSGYLLRGDNPRSGYDVASVASLGLTAYTLPRAARTRHIFPTSMALLGGLSTVGNTMRSYQMRTGKPRNYSIWQA
ncbi:hypothetical protein BC832DRAFT_567524 [Gaertneriomyces semiglobifer]|nr:hypothetical protein BC832DRAFT_567524 [Gaertneriomyces semiglobifer]